ncbi:hypothetical protein [Kineococcus sp. G2]|uniref:hypothetical protein n=1 Tax=Kineococcus sp. G2 TaxID=3127484 RepID=UPI00301DB98D
MSYDVAVWEGPYPESDQAAGAEFTARVEALDAAEQAGQPRPRPSAALRAFLSDVRAHLPAGARDVDGVWAVEGPLSEDAAGSFFHTAMTAHGAEVALTTIAGLAGAHGLVCFDPQAQTLVRAPAPPAPVRRPPRPGVGTFLRMLHQHLGGHGFTRGKRGLHLQVDQHVRISVLAWVSTQEGHREVGAVVAAYRLSDWHAWLREDAQLAGTPVDLEEEVYGGGELDDFGLRVQAGELLARPHQHGWLVPDRAAVQAAAEHVGQLVVQRYLPHVPVLAQALPSKGEVDERVLLQVPFEQWLSRDERCPWAPCAEELRRVSAGGLWPDDDGTGAGGLSALLQRDARRH